MFCPPLNAAWRGGRGCLNPLHCGAVVASTRLWVRQICLRLVSIPFIAGQWSLQVAKRSTHLLVGVVSIPFIAGQWSLRNTSVEPVGSRQESQSPSLRGSGRFRMPIPSPGGGVTPVSIPFIAGQWSLLRRRVGGGGGPPGLNPLHCGAVVASPAPPLRSRRGRRLNPLHCGAVVASSVRRMAGVGGGGRSQSPSLRGSGRFRIDDVRRPRAGDVSIPFIAGQWSLQEGGCRRGARTPVSIPFIAGQWSLPGGASGVAPPRRLSQSPSLRGSGRFLLPL